MLYSSSFHTTVVSDGLHEPYLLLTNSSFILILSDLHRGCLIWVKFVEIPKQKFESQLNVICLLFILWQSTLFQPIKARVLWKLYYKPVKSYPFSPTAPVQFKFWVLCSLHCAVYFYILWVFLLLLFISSNLFSFWCLESVAVCVQGRICLLPV